MLGWSWAVPSDEIVREWATGGFEALYAMGGHGDATERMASRSRDQLAILLTLERSPRVLPRVALEAWRQSAPRLVRGRLAASQPSDVSRFRRLSPTRAARPPSRLTCVAWGRLIPAFKRVCGLPHDANRASDHAHSPVCSASRLPLLRWPDPIRLQSTGLRTRKSDSSQGRRSNEVPGSCRGRATCRPVRPFGFLFLRRCLWI